MLFALEGIDSKDIDALLRIHSYVVRNIKDNNFQSFIF